MIYTVNILRNYGAIYRFTSHCNLIILLDVNYKRNDSKLRSKLEILQLIDIIKNTQTLINTIIPKHNTIKPLSYRQKLLTSLI